MQDDAVQLIGGKEPVSLHRLVLRGDGLERAVDVAGEDDVDDVLRDEAIGRDRVGDRDGPLEGRRLDAHLLRDLALERVEQALAGVDAAAGEQPASSPVLLVPAEQQALLPAQDGGHPHPRLGAHALRPRGAEAADASLARWAARRPR